MKTNSKRKRCPADKIFPSNTRKETVTAIVPDIFHFIVSLTYCMKWALRPLWYWSGLRAKLPYFIYAWFVILPTTWIFTTFLSVTEKDVFIAKYNKEKVKVQESSCSKPPICQVKSADKSSGNDQVIVLNLKVMWRELSAPERAIKHFTVATGNLLYHSCSSITTPYLTVNRLSSKRACSHNTSAPCIQ